MEKSFFPRRLYSPIKRGGYLVLAKYRPDVSNGNQMEKSSIISRRYINIGKLKKYDYFNLLPQPLDKINEYFK
jgi:hypothetical protein